MKITACQCFGSLCGVRSRVRPRIFYFCTVKVKLLASFVLLTLICSPRISAQPPSHLHRDHIAQRLSEAPRIDGKANDETWSTLPAANNFTQFQPEPGKPSRYHTDVKIGYTDQA